jgi:hypothetical protein
MGTFIVIYTALNSKVNNASKINKVCLRLVNYIALLKKKRKIKNL